jgi:hypothetical protein
MGDLPGVRNLLKGGEANIMATGATARQWAPLHIAVWGTGKPQNDKDIVEALLLSAQKNGKEAEIRAHEENSEEKNTPLDLAKIRRDGIQTVPGAEEGAGLEEKRKYDKIVEWLEKGLPTG